LYIREGTRGNVYKFKMDLRRDAQYVKTIYVTIGRADVVTYEQAVAEAARLAKLVRAGVDPTQVKDPSVMTVRDLMDHYAQDLKDRGKGERFRGDVVKRAERYLNKWLDRPFVGISRQECRDAHARITRENGPRVANQTMTNFATAWKIARQTLDGEVPECPVSAVRLHRETAKDYGSFDADAFWRAVASAGQTRALAWQIGLLTGLRPGNLKTLRREWVQADRLVIPRAEMKVKDARRGPFIVPLSEPLAALCRLAAAYAATADPASPWLFWADSESGHIEQLHPWGHVLRHVHRTACTEAGVHPEIAAVLHDHAIGGIAETYMQRAVINFDTLMDAQRKVTQVLLGNDKKVLRLATA